MKAAVMYGPRDVRVETVELPSVKADEVLVRVKACGICGTDAHTYKMGDPSTSASTAILGHEFSGEIVDVGTAVEGFSVGDRVVGTGRRHCGECFSCRQGQTDRCLNPAVPGHRLDGAFAEYVIVPNPVLDTTLFHIPESMSWEVGATVEPVSAACFFVDRARIREGETVVVLGAGMIGQTVAQVCKAAAAARVIVSEPSPGRLQKAAALGADETLNPLETNPVEAVAKATAGRMADVVFECSGVPIAFHQGLQMLRFSGRMMQVAYFEKTLELPPDIMTLVVDKSLMLRGCAGQTWDKALELVRTEQINTKDLITHRFPLDSIKEAFEAHVNADQAIKVMVTP